MLDGSSGNEYEDQMRAKAVTNMVKGLVKDDTIVEAAMQKQLASTGAFFPSLSPQLMEFLIFFLLVYVI